MLARPMSRARCTINAMELLAILAVAWSLFITVLWLVIGFRAMRAHEELAERTKTISKAITSIAAAIESRPSSSSSDQA